VRTFSLYLLALLAVISAMLLGHAFGRDPGSVLIRVAGWRIETTLAGSLLGALGLSVLGYLLYLLLRWPIALFIGYRRKRARNFFDEGLSALYEGRFKRAERSLVLAGTRGRHAQLAWIGAARAAFEQGKLEAMDSYLSRAQVAGIHPNSVRLTRAHLLFEGKNYAPAAEILEALLSEEPKHVYALKLLARVLQADGRLGALETRLPAMIKARVLPTQELAALTAEVLRERLTHADNAAALSAAWREVPRQERSESAVLMALGEAAARLQEPEPAADLIIARLRDHWDDGLIDVLGRIEGPGIEMRLRKAEGWLTERPQSAPLLLALARLCRAQGLWGKARDYFQSSLSFKASAQGYEELGELLQEHGDPNVASRCYLNALRLNRGLKPEPINAQIKPSQQALIGQELRSSHGVPMVSYEPRADS